MSFRNLIWPSMLPGRISLTTQVHRPLPCREMKLHHNIYCTGAKMFDSCLRCLMDRKTDCLFRWQVSIAVQWGMFNYWTISWQTLWHLFSGKALPAYFCSAALKDTSHSTSHYKFQLCHCALPEGPLAPRNKISRGLVAWRAAAKLFLHILNIILGAIYLFNEKMCITHSPESAQGSIINCLIWTEPIPRQCMSQHLDEIHFSEGSFLKDLKYDPHMKEHFKTMPIAAPMTLDNIFKTCCYNTASKKQMPPLQFYSLSF